MLIHMYPGLVALGENDIQAPAYAVNAVVYSTALTTHISAMSQACQKESCKTNLDLYHATFPHHFLSSTARSIFRD